METYRNQQPSQVYIAFPIHLQQLNSCPAYGRSAEDERFILVPLKMSAPFVCPRIEKAVNLIGERVVMLCFIVLVTIAATICQSEVVGGSSASQTYWDDMVKRKCVRGKTGRDKTIFAAVFGSCANKFLNSYRNI